MRQKVESESHLEKSQDLSRRAQKPPSLTHLDHLKNGTLLPVRRIRFGLVLTAQSENELRDLALDDTQWDLLEQLVRVLKIFKEATNLFSQSEVPLIHEVVPIFVCMQQHLERIQEDSGERLHPLIRAAAHWSLLVYNKYMGLFTESEVYWIAVVMCPDRKLQWLCNNGCSEADISQVFSMVAARFNSLHPSPSMLDTPATTEKTSDKLDIEDEWLFSEKPSTTSGLQLGSIESYLRTEPISSEVIRLAGASSVDVERAFSCGRLMNNYLQHQMSPETFCAKMALQSWFETPVLRDVDDVASLLEGNVLNCTPIDL
ncbi:hypothetical protein RHS03_09994, partial [Rhizoctonia solani]